MGTLILGRELVWVKSWSTDKGIGTSLFFHTPRYYYGSIRICR